MINRRWRIGKSDLQQILLDLNRHQCLLIKAVLLGIKYWPKNWQKTHKKIRANFASEIHMARISSEEISGFLGKISTHRITEGSADFPSVEERAAGSLIDDVLSVRSRAVNVVDLRFVDRARQLHLGHADAHPALVHQVEQLSQTDQPVFRADPNQHRPCCLLKSH